jgi:hypothetical protein
MKGAQKETAYLMTLRQRNGESAPDVRAVMQTIV